MKTRAAIVLFSLVPAFAHAQSPPPGEWEAPFNFGSDPGGADRIGATDMIHVFDGATGKMLVHTIMYAPTGCIFGLSRLWTPPPMGSPSGDPGVVESVPVDPCDTRMFCQGHAALANGRVLHVGGGDSEDPFFEAEMFYPEVPPPAAS